MMNKTISLFKCKSSVSAACAGRKHRWHGLEAGILLAFLLLAFTPVSAQDRIFPVPSPRQTLNIKDPGALAEVTAFIRAASASGWQGLTGTGRLTYPAGDAHAAQLYLLGDALSRLDISMNSGMRSLRVGSSKGTFQDERGQRHTLPPATSGAALVALPRVWADAIGSTRVSLYDDGVFDAAGRQLHRITMEYALRAHKASSIETTMATDIYFDPATHLLWFSVDEVASTGPTNRPFQRVTMYSDYTVFNGLLFPAEIQQMLDGQSQWTLRLTEVNANSAPSDDMFAF